MTGRFVLGAIAAGAFAMTSFAAVPAQAQTSTYVCNVVRSMGRDVAGFGSCIAFGGAPAQGPFAGPTVVRPRVAGLRYLCLLGQANTPYSVRGTACRPF